MKSPPREPVRLLDLRPPDAPVDVARLLRTAIGAPEDPVLPLKGRIRNTLRRKSASRRRYLRAALMSGAIFVSGGVVGAVVQPILRPRSQPAIETVEDIYPSPSARRSRSGRLSAPTPTAVKPGELVAVEGDQAPSLPPMSAPAPTPTQTVKAPAARAERGRDPENHPIAIAVREQAPRQAEHPKWSSSPGSASLEPPALEPPPPLHPASRATAPSPLLPAHEGPAQAAAAQGMSPRYGASPTASPTVTAPPPSEHAILARAVRSLRVEHRPATALAALDEYGTRYPNGSMLAEATRLRAEALLLLGRRRAALAELSREPAPGIAGDEESRLVRGELRASAGRWSEALQDFNAVLSAQLAHEPRADAAISPRLRGRFERALWGRASARSRLGDEAGARADLQEYLRRFAHGRFAAPAARLLGEPR
jgi:hypothetical protein